MKHNLILLVAFLILGLSVFNIIEDDNEMHDHASFFEEVRQFMDRGDRNTAQMGYRTCLTQNQHSQHLGIPLRDCCEEYFDGDSEKCDENRP